MSKNQDVFKISANKTMFLKKGVSANRKGAKDAIEEIIIQAKQEGLRDTTINDYRKWWNKYTVFNEVKFIDELDSKTIYNWLDSMNVQNSTKRIRLKAIKAILNRMYKARIIDTDFFSQIKIKVDEQIKKGTEKKDLEKLLSNLDMTDYAQFRDATAILLIWNTGIRIATLSKLRIHNIDFKNKLLVCEGSLIKNGKQLILPLNDNILDFLNILITQNNIITNELGYNTDLIFMTKRGHNLETAFSNNSLGKRLREYSIKWNIPNINAHAIRRGFAKRLLDGGVSVPVISKALGHSSLAVTTKYLNISEVEVINELKRLL